MKNVSVRFYHGLGDCANFARLIPLYSKRGHKISVECTPDKEILFRAAGAAIVRKARQDHPWGYPPGDVFAGQGHDRQGSKPGWNISQPPLPNLGAKDDLWPEYCQTKVRPTAHLPPQEIDAVRKWLEPMKRPLVLLHTKGNTAQRAKSLPDDVTRRFYREFIDRSDGTLILLDWDHRVPCPASARVRPLAGLEGGCSTERMFALMDRADLLVGVDSGPLHACGLTDTPSMGIWMPGHYPARYALPRRNQLNVVLAAPTRKWNRFRRVPWNIVEHPAADYDPARLAALCVQMLEPARYLSAEDLGADIQLQQWVMEWCRGTPDKGRSNYNDRNRSFDVLLRAVSKRFEQPTVIETGTIRSEEDWSGAGFFTYLMGTYLFRTGGVLHSVDLDPQHCRFAGTWCRLFGRKVAIHCQDSVAFLQEFRQPIDLLYLDSLDTYQPGHSQHAMSELRAAITRLHPLSIVVFDDTPFHNGAFTGKGALAVPWLIERGWKILYAGYQVVLSRTPA